MVKWYNLLWTPAQEVRVRFLYPLTLEKCSKGVCLCNLLQSTQPSDRENLIEGEMRRVSVKRSRIFCITVALLLGRGVTNPKKKGNGECDTVLPAYYQQYKSKEQWRNFAGLVIMAPPGSKKSPPSGAPSRKACWGQYVKIRPKNLNKLSSY